jgi:hypothetical protein
LALWAKIDQFLVSAGHPDSPLPIAVSLAVANRVALREEGDGGGRLRLAVVTEYPNGHLARWPQNDPDRLLRFVRRHTVTILISPLLGVLRAGGHEECAVELGFSDQKIELAAFVRDGLRLPIDRIIDPYLDPRDRHSCLVDDDSLDPSPGWSGIRRLGLGFLDECLGLGCDLGLGWHQGLARSGDSCGRGDDCGQANGRQRCEHHGQPCHQHHLEHSVG